MSSNVFWLQYSLIIIALLLHIQKHQTSCDSRQHQANKADLAREGTNTSLFHLGFTKRFKEKSSDSNDSLIGIRMFIRLDSHLRSFQNRNSSTCRIEQPEPVGCYV